MRRRKLLTGAVALGAYAALAGASLAFPPRSVLLGGARPLTGGIVLSFPMDAVASINWSGCYGVGALTAAWKTGNLFDVVVGGVPRTIKAVNGGYPDVATLAALMGIGQSNGIGGLLISKWYDQSGKGNDVAQATTANQPAIWLVNGKVYVFFGGVLDYASTFAGQPQFLTNGAAQVNAQSFSLFSLFKPYSSSNSTIFAVQDFGTIFSPQSTASFIVTHPGSFFTSSQAFLIDDTSFATAGLTTPNFGNQMSVVTAVGAASAGNFLINEVAATPSAAMNAGTFTGIIVGCNPAAAALFPQGASGRMLAFMLSADQISPTNQARIRNALYGFGNTQKNAVSALTNVVIDGASFEQGQGGDPSGLYAVQNGGGYGWAEMLEDSLASRNILFNNTGRAGATIAQCTANYAGQTSLCFSNNATKNVLIGPCSAYWNSIVGSGARTGAQAYSDFQAWLAAVKANAWTTIFAYILPPNGNAQVSAFNALMQAGAAGNGITLIDMSANAQLWTGPYVSVDGLHPTVLGYQVMLGYIAPAVQQAL